MRLLGAPSERGRSVLVITPLAMDAVASCGGTLARLASGGVRVLYVVVYDGGVPEDRLRRACRILGIAPDGVSHLRLRLSAEAAEVRASIRRVVAKWATSGSPALALAPSLRSADPRDALVGRAAFEEARGHTLLCYECATRPDWGDQPVVLFLSPAHVRSKLLAVRPRRLRPGAKAPVARTAAFEILELAHLQTSGPLPLAELQQTNWCHEQQPPHPETRAHGSEQPSGSG